MKLKEKATLLGIIGVSHIALIGMMGTSQQLQAKAYEQEIRTVEEKMFQIEGTLSSMGEELTSINVKLQNTKNDISEINKEISELKQPTIDSQKETDIEENVELKPVKPVARTVQPQPKATSPQYKEVSVRVSFYTDLAKENGGYAGKNAIGGKLKLGSVSAPKSVPFGAKISIQEMQNRIGCSEFTVDDRGGAIYIEDGVYRLDVYVPRKQGESDNEYFNRVNDMGIVNTKAKIYFK